MELAAQFPHPPSQRSRKGVATRELIFTHPPIPLGLSLSVSNFARSQRQLPSFNTVPYFGM